MAETPTRVEAMIDVKEVKLIKEYENHQGRQPIRFGQFALCCLVTFKKTYNWHRGFGKH